MKKPKKHDSPDKFTEDDPATMSVWVLIGILGGLVIVLGWGVAAGKFKEPVIGIKPPPTEWAKGVK